LPGPLGPSVRSRAGGLFLFPRSPFFSLRFVSLSVSGRAFGAAQRRRVLGRLHGPSSGAACAAQTSQLLREAERFARQARRSSRGRGTCRAALPIGGCVPTLRVRALRLRAPLRVEPFELRSSIRAKHRTRGHSRG